jgi:hypothetical protein
VALWIVRREAETVAGALGEREANSGLTGGWFPVMGSTPMA